MNKLTDGLSSLYIERAGTPEERDKIVDAMIDRQAIIEKEDSEWPLLAIFPESTTTNGQYLLPFKRGAFQAMKPIVPSYLTYNFKTIFDIRCI